MTRGEQMLTDDERRAIDSLLSQGTTFEDTHEYDRVERLGTEGRSPGIRQAHLRPEPWIGRATRSVATTRCSRDLR